MTVDGAFIQKLRNDFFSGRTVIGKLCTAQTVFLISKQVIQRNYGVLSGEVGGNVIRVGDADIGCRIGGNIGNDIVVNFAVIRVQVQVYRDIGIQGFKICNGFLVDFRLGFVGIIFRPEGDLIVPGSIEFLRNGEFRQPLGTMAAGQRQGQPAQGT